MEMENPGPCWGQDKPVCGPVNIVVLDFSVRLVVTRTSDSTGSLPWGFSLCLLSIRGSVSSKGKLPVRTIITPCLYMETGAFSAPEPSHFAA